MRILVALMISLGLATPARAQTTPTAPAGSQADPNLPAASPRALALSRRYLELTQAEALTESLSPSITASMTASFPAAVPDSFVEAMDPWPVVQDLLPELMDRMAVVQAQVYSEAELQALVDFYDAPIGRAIVAKTPKLTPGMTAVMFEFAPRIRERVRRRLCAAEHPLLKCGSERAR